VPDVPSLLLDGTTLFTIEDGGVMNAFQADSGKLLQKRRLPGTFSASPIACAGHLFACNEEGTTYVLRLQAPWEILAENPLGEAILATPAISREEIFIRTDTSLVCIRAAAEPEDPLPAEGDAPRAPGP
jgi:outer membrane protein assembly factor BamB